MGDCFVPRSDISFGLLEKTFLDSYMGWFDFLEPLADLWK
jgi:hypothetical protein